MKMNEWISRSVSVWEGWNNLGYPTREAILQRWSEQLPSACRAMVRYQCQQAAEHAAVVDVLPGPTGESNERYCAGRGILAITVDAQAPEVALYGQLAAALVTGNTVFVCLPAGYSVVAEDVAAQLEQSGCAGGVVTAISPDQLSGLICHPAVVGVAYAGKPASVQQLACQLAARDGQLALLVSETDCEQLPVIGSTTYSLRFVTERTRTINITAVGGNASLLELGSGGEH